MAELGSAEQSIELVWGIGLSRWLKDGSEIDLPLLERLVEIEIGEAAGGAIRVRARGAPASANLRPYEELKIGGASIALDAARRALAIAEATDGVTPFLRDSFEPVLRACQARLDAEGRYLPDTEKLDPAAPIPAPTAQLAVSDRWVIFARRRSDNFLLHDIANLKKSIERADGDIPSPARTLVMGPASQSDDSWRPLSMALGEAIGVDVMAPTQSPLGDLFFPKPFNDAQARIIEDLERSIVSMRQRLASIDTEISALAKAQLSPVLGTSLLPAELAKTVAQSRDRFGWFSDRPRSFTSQLDLSEADIAAVRNARIALGSRIEHIDALLPALNDLPDGVRVARLHADIVRAGEFAEIVSQDRSLAIRISSSEALQHADQAVQAIESLVAISSLTDEPWLRDLAELAITGEGSQGVLGSLRDFIAEAGALLEEHDRYLQRPVDVPSNFVHSDEVIAVISRLANGEQVFRLFAFKEKALRPTLEALRVVSRAPSEPQEWAHIRDHLRWRARMLEVDRRCFVPISSPLGRQLLGLTEEDEVEFEANGQVRRVLVVRAARENTRSV